MHELSIAESILEMVEQEALHNHFTKVKTITLTIGAVAGVEIELLNTYLPLVFDKTLAAEAHVIIEPAPAEAICNSCNEQSKLQSLHEMCPHCQAFQWQWISGREIKIKDLLVV